MKIGAVKAEALIDAMHQYSNPRFGDEVMLVITDDRGVRQPFPIYEACRIAAVTLEQRNLDALKFRALVDRMKAHRMGDLYQMLMGGPLP